MANDELKQQAMQEMARREIAKRQSTPQEGFGSMLLKNAGIAARDTAESAGVMANTALMEVPAIASQAMTGGKFTGSIYPIIEGGKNVFEGNDLSEGQKIMSTAAGIVAPTGGAFKAIGEIPAIKSIMKFSKSENQAKLADEVQNTMMSQRRKVIDNYGPEYDSIIGKQGKKVNINTPIKNFVDSGQSIMQNPEFSQQIAYKNPQANKIMDMIKTVTDLKVPDEISAREADSLSKFIKNIPSIKSKLAQGSKYGFHTVQWTNEDRMLIGLADDIKGEVINAHPDLVDLNKDYGDFMNSYKSVSPDFKIGNTVSKLKKYSDYDPQKRILFEKIMPKSTVDKIKSFEQADKASRLLKSIGMWGVRGAAGAAGFKGIAH